MSHKKTVLLLVGLLLLGAALWLVWLTRTSFSEDDSTPSTRSVRELSTRIAKLEAREQAADKTYWAKEMLAQSCGRTFESLWDSLNAATDKLDLVATFPIGEIVMPGWATPQRLPHGIELREGQAPGPVLSAGQWRQRVEQFEREGWQLENVEFRHIRFDTDEHNQPLRSHFLFSAHLTNPGHSQRASVDGDLVVDWAAKQSGEVCYPVKRIDASHLALKSRAGETPFQLILDDEIPLAGRTVFIDPLILYDLDGDGLPEIILAGANLVYRRRGPDHYQAEPLCRYPADFITSAVIADFDGDGAADFLCANSRGLFLFKGSPEGHFDEPGRLVWPANPPLQNTMVLTCGDIDEDGSLDIFLGQYKVPTLGQTLRPYYYDANDGWPAYLLRNDGHGNFTDVTAASGLGPKRWRRTYAASLADLDGDGHPDLVVVSDFAGLDLYQNDGHGHFTDVTRQWVAESHAFGMALALADFNVDGRMDLLMIGMPSPTVDRLQHLDLWRPYSAEDRLRRPAMTYGNRLYVGRPGGGFEQTSLNDSIARSGWSWGCGAFDFDNDGFPDVYIANGLRSKQTVREYEPEFWLHSIFIDETIDDATASGYFMDQANRTLGQGWSYGGYEKNRLYLNQHGQSFVEIGHLAGVALEQDSRNVVADDLDGDGRVDLAVTTLEEWPKPKQTLRLYKNVLSDAGNWIGFSFREEDQGKSPVGVRVTIHYDGHGTTRQIVTGDSHRSQHSNTIHFGLGAADRLDRAEMVWANGSSVTLHQPAVNQYHLVRIPTESPNRK